MLAMFHGRTSIELFTIFIAIVIGAPISEELAVRYFLMDAFAFRKSRTWAWVAVLATSSLFAFAHAKQYVNPTTLLQIFLIGALMGYYRISTNGIALPIVLHAEADALGLLTLT